MKTIRLPRNLGFWCLIVAIVVGNTYLAIITVVDTRY